MPDTNVVIAVRVSSDEQRNNGYSHTQQLRELPRLVVEQTGWKIAERPGGRGPAIYDEGAASSQAAADEESSLEHRPAMLDLLAELGDTNPTYVVCLSKDRLFRNTHEYTSFQRAIMRAGVQGFAEWPTLSGSPRLVQLDDPEQRAFSEMQAVMASLETAIRARRVALGRKEHAAKRLPNGGRAPFGYAWGGKKKPHIVDLEQRGTYERMVELALSGMGSAAIAAVLREEKRRTQSGTFKWTPCTVRRILASQAQLGRIPAPDASREDGLATSWVEGAGMEPLIDEERWKQMRAVVTSRSRNEGHGNRRRHPLAGLLRCPTCGCTLKMRPDRRKTAQGVRLSKNYECRRSTGCDGGVSISEGRALDELQTLVTERLERTLWTCQVPADVDPEVHTLEHRLTAASEKLTAAERRLKRARHAYENVEDDALAAEEFERMRGHQSTVKTARNEIERLEDALRVRKGAPPVADVEELRGVLRGWRAFTDDEKRAILETLLARVVVLPNRSGRRLEVEWR